MPFYNLNDPKTRKYLPIMELIDVLVTEVIAENFQKVHKIKQDIITEVKKLELKKFSTEWMKHRAETCGANKKGFCEALWEDCDVQCVTDSKEYKEHQKKFLKKLDKERKKK